MISARDFAQDLLSFIEKSPTAFHAVAQVEKHLSAAGFTKLSPGAAWKVRAGGKHWVTRNGSALIAFVVGTAPLSESGFRLVGCHTDAPTFRVKPSPEMSSEGGYVRLNTEVYGGPILSTWLDRPLSLAGRVVLTGKDPLHPDIRLIDLRRPICIIPNLAIHMNREVNKGVELNAQVDTLPLLTILDKKATRNGLLRSLVAGELGVGESDVLDMDLYLYEASGGTLLGCDEEFISSGRLDDLAAVHAASASLISLTQPAETAVLACFDNEEVGSSSKQGANCPFLGTTLERILLARGMSREAYFQSLDRSFLVSVDGAHAVHPGRGEKSDPTNRPMLNGGPVLKISANQRYTSDADSIGVFKEICRNAGVPIQVFVNHSTQPGGSTIGPLSSTQVDIRALDIGTPMLAMHSIRELAGVRDHLWMQEALTAFWLA